MKALAGGRHRRRELPPGCARQAGPGLGGAVGGEPGPRHAAPVGLRADRPMAAQLAWGHRRIDGRASLRDGLPDRPPVKTGISIGDSIAALWGVIGAMMALRHKEVNGGQGQVVDVALYEAVFAMMESLVPEFDVFGFVRASAPATSCPASRPRTRIRRRTASGMSPSVPTAMRSSVACCWRWGGPTSPTMHRSPTTPGAMRGATNSMG